MKNFIKRLIPKAYIKYFRIIFTKSLDIKGNIYKFYNQLLLPKDIKRKIKLGVPLKINLCSGEVKIDGFINVDVWAKPDIYLDLEDSLIPLPNSSAKVVVMMSAINYFTRDRALLILKDIHRILKPSGILRVGVQDLKLISKKYIDKDREFFFQKKIDGKDRFPGETFADKFNYFFYRGFSGIKGKHHKYMFDYETMEKMFSQAGFKNIKNKKFLDSEIDEIDQIDNRPEMFFYIEAIKDSESHYLNEAKEFIKHKKNEQAWQYILKALDLNEQSIEAFQMAYDHLINLKRFDSLQALISRYKSNKLIKQFLNDKRDDWEKIYKANIYLNKKQIINNRKYLLKSYKKNTPADDVYHLDQSMNWLFNTFSISSDGGIPAKYRADSDTWADSYPETTGYIIPTFLAYARISGNKKFKSAAIDMGFWEIRIQSPDGGIGEPAGLFNENAIKPRIFNTAQVILGWLALYRETNDEQFLLSAIRGGEYIISRIEDNGTWNFGPFNTPKSYNIRVAWSLLELSNMTKNKNYNYYADKIIDWVLSQTYDNYWQPYSHFSISEKINKKLGLTHLMGYTLVGLVNVIRLDNNKERNNKIVKLLTQSSESLISIYEINNRQNRNSKFVGFPGLIDRNWNPASDWSCITGNAQIEFFLRSFFEISYNKKLLDMADKLAFDLKSVQVLGENISEKMKGGFFGSDPINGEYDKFNIPNWGVKFYADTILKKNYQEEDLYCIG